MDKELSQHEFIDTTAKWGRDFVEVLKPLKENEILRVYHEPPQREWVNLTVEERETLRNEYEGSVSGLISAVQMMLKEKNA
jgi:hypothetical protein